MSDNQTQVQTTQDSPAEYIKALKPELREDVAFLMGEIDRLWSTHPNIVEHLFSRCTKHARGDRKLTDKIEATKMRWELEHTKDDDLFDSPGTDTSAAKNEISVSDTASWTKYLPTKLFTAIDYVKQNSFKVLVVAPVILFALYLVLFASPRYESQAQLVIKQPDGMATMEPSLALLSGLGGSANSVDTDLVKAYIWSNDMLTYLDQQIDYSTHFQTQSYDMFSNLSDGATREDKLAFLQAHISVDIDPASSIITVTSQGFEAEYARLVTQTITDRAEYFINKIGHDLAKAQLEFIKTEHELVEQKLQSAQSKLLAFQREYNLLDPEAEGVALQQITFQIEGQIAAKTAEVNALRSSMSDSAPMVRSALDELKSLKDQLASERSRLTRTLGNNDNDEQAASLGVNAILTKFSDFKIDLEFALQAYSSSKISLEKSRIQAYRQLKYLVVIEAPTLPEEAKYPRVFYNVSLLLVILLVIFTIGKMIIATADELK